MILILKNIKYKNIVSNCELHNITASSTLYMDYFIHSIVTQNNYIYCNYIGVRQI